MSTEDIDLDKLQAQIDLSLSITYDLVSSKLRFNTTSIPPSAYSEKELQELKSRPARLGLGAPIPATSKETVKLHQKLVGKKRHREAEAEMTAPASDEEDSRVGAISSGKSQIIQDKFGIKKKRKIDPDTVNPFRIQAISQPVSLAPLSPPPLSPPLSPPPLSPPLSPTPLSPTTGKHLTSANVLNLSGSDQDSPVNTPETKAKKKRRRKKKKKGTSQPGI